MSPTTPAKISKFKTGWQFTKSAWRVLRDDKQLASFPIFSLLITFILLIPFIVFIGANPAFSHHAAGQQFYTGRGLVIWIALIMLLTIVSNFFSAAIIDGAMTHFKGGDPTFRKSLNAASHKFLPIAYFSVYMATFGIIVQLISERIPFAGRLVLWIADLAWTIANFFSLPVIMFEKPTPSPVGATKESARLIKQVWGEGVVANTSMGLIGSLGMLALMLVIMAVIAIGVGFSLGAIFFIPAVAVSVVAYFVGLGVVTALGSILKAALYYYATTGRAPATFSAENLQRAIIQKRRRRLFAR